MSVALGAVLLVAVVALLAKMYLDHRNGTSARRGREAAHQEGCRRWRSARRSASSSGSPRSGSGTLVIILLLFLYPRLRGSQMVGTDLAQAIPMVGSAALAHIVFGDFKLGLTLSILIGSIPGVLIGASVSSYAPTAFLRGALAAVLLVSGLKLVNVPTLAIGIVLLVSRGGARRRVVVRSGRAGGRSARSRARPCRSTAAPRTLRAGAAAGSLSEA